MFSAKGIQIEEGKIEVVKNIEEPKSVKEIQVFLIFVNFYRRFIKSFGMITARLTLMLKITTTRLTKVPPTFDQVGFGE